MVNEFENRSFLVSEFVSDLDSDIKVINRLANKHNISSSDLAKVMDRFSLSPQEYSEITEPEQAFLIKLFRHRGK